MQRFRVTRHAFILQTTISDTVSSMKMFDYGDTRMYKFTNTVKTKAEWTPSLTPLRNTSCLELSHIWTHTWTPSVFA